MIIERQGIFDDGRERFDCIHCGSVFVAEEHEYKIIRECAFIPPHKKTVCPVCGSCCSKTIYPN